MLLEVAFRHSCLSQPVRQIDVAQAGCFNASIYLIEYQGAALIAADSFDNL